MVARDFVHIYTMPEGLVEGAISIKSQAAMVSTIFHSHAVCFHIRLTSL